MGRLPNPEQPFILTKFGLKTKHIAENLALAVGRANLL